MLADDLQGGLDLIAVFQEAERLSVLCCDRQVRGASSPAFLRRGDLVIPQAEAVRKSGCAERRAHLVIIVVGDELQLLVIEGERPDGLGDEGGGQSDGIGDAIHA